jgi:hypothetical protein
MPRLVAHQQPLEPTQEPTGIAAVDGVLVDGRDLFAAHRQMVREANMARQRGEASAAGRPLVPFEEERAQFVAQARAAHDAEQRARAGPG